MLYLHYNKIAHIEPPPASVPSNSLASLRSLSLRSVQRTFLTTTNNYQQRGANLVARLNVDSHNELPSVPAGLMSRLTGLSLLFLEHNRLEELPDAVCGLTRLELLRVDCNRLRCLPNGMSGMTQLIGTHARSWWRFRVVLALTSHTTHDTTHTTCNTTYQPSTATTIKSRRFRGTCCN